MDSRDDLGQDDEVEGKRYGIRDVWQQKKRWFWAGAVLTFIIILLASGLLLFVSPMDYTARVRMEIMRDSQSFEVFPENSVRDRRVLEDHSTFVRNEVLKISSKETLYNVIEELQLVKKWDEAKSPAEAYKMLLEKLTVEHLPESSIVDLTLVHSDPQEAADLANAIAQGYKEARVGQEMIRALNALDMLNAQETLQEQKVEDSRQRMIELMEKFDIVDLGIQSSTAPGSDMPETGSSRIVTDVEAAVAKAEAETTELTTEIDKVNEFSNENKLLWLQHKGRLTPYGASLLDELGKLQLKLAMVRPEEASEVSAEARSEGEDLRRQEENLRKLMDRVIAEHNFLLKAEYDIAVARLTNLRRFAEEKRDDAMSERKSYTQYVEARRAFEVQSDILKDMRLLLLREKVDLSLPKSPIEMYEIAEPTEEPAGEFVEKGLKAAAVTAALWAIPGGLLCMYIAFGFSASREYEYVYEIVDEDGVPEAVEVSDGESSPY